MPTRNDLSAAQLAALHDVLTGRAPASFMRLEYRAGTRDLGVTRRGEGYQPVEASWGRPDPERPGQEFLGTFKEVLPFSLLGETLTVDLVVETEQGDLKFRRFTGRIALMTPTVAGTQIQAASGGFWVDKVIFNEARSYVDVAPSEVVSDCVAFLAEAGVYDVQHADIEHVPGPKVRREEFLLIRPVDTPARPIAAAVEEGNLFFRDNTLNAPMCHRDRGPAEAEETEWDYTVGEDTEPSEWLPETEGHGFYDVVPHRDNDDGTVDFILETDGDPDTRGIRVPGSKAPKGASYLINVSDQSDTATDDAYQQAVEAASRLIDGEATTTQTIKWIHPLLVDGDFLSWAEPFDEGDRSGTRFWIAKLENLKETHDLTQELPMLMVKTREELETVPRVAALPAPKVRGA